MVTVMKIKAEEPWEYRLIDGNWSPRAVAYCTYHHGYLTPALIRVHNCRKRKCQRLRNDIEKEVLEE